MKKNITKENTVKEKLLNLETRNVSMFRCIYLIMATVAVMMSAVNFFTGKSILMVYTLSFGMLCGMNIVLTNMGQKWEEAAKILFQIELCFLCLYFVVSGEPDGFSAIWLLLVPGCSFLLFERRNAVILCVAIFLLLVFFFYTPAGRGSLEYGYTDTFMMRFPLLYIAFTAAAMFLSYSMEVYQEKLREVQQGLEDEISARTRELVEKEMELEKLKNEAMISQIQPHFMYNTISAIAAIPGNSDETIDALVDFGKYLRVNIDAFSDGSVIPVDSELEHVKRYVNLEKLRFEDKITLQFEILDHDFLIPPLTIQMLVENAIKHGLQPRRKSGTVKVITERLEDNHVVTVKDDGVGFQTENLQKKGRGHAGLKNVEERIGKACGGWLEIESEKGKGTEVRVYIPEWRDDYEDNCS